MLIVEGPDGAGKTTLIEELKHTLDLPVAPRVVSKTTEDLVNLQDWVDENLDKGFQGLIFDRYRLISETIYGPILRPEPRPGFADLLWMKQSIHRFYQIRPIIIYCLPPLNIVRDNIINDPDNLRVADYIDQVYASYVARASLDALHADVHFWDYTSPFNLDGRPTWFHRVVHDMHERLY